MIGFGDAVVIGIAFAALVFFAQWIGWDWGTVPLKRVGQGRQLFAVPRGTATLPWTPGPSAG